VKSKISGVPQIIATLTDSVEKPVTVPVKNLRPARDTCEACHRPEKFSGDLVRTHTTFGTDEANTAKVDTRVLRVGGGAPGTATGIHWHVAADVWYLPVDEGYQEIAWVGVDNGQNRLDEYIDPKLADHVSPESIGMGQRLMDCIDCHNRATHVFRSPEQLIDAAMTEGRIDASLPYIKKKAMEALEPPSSSVAEADSKVDAVREFYISQYADVYQLKSGSLNSSIEEMKRIIRLTTFPDMKVDYKTYVNNVGHLESPGCFRCHGKLVASAGPDQGKAIDADCTSCHYMVSSGNP
jgi:hypothetical protein